MRTRTSARGFTLIENMAAFAVVLIGATGLASMYTMGVRMNGDARRMTRATAIAEDLIDNIALWPYGSTALANTKTGNDGDIGDTAFAFETSADPVAAGIADHGEADLTALGASWTGIPGSELAGQYERYWNVAYVDTNGDGTSDVLEIAVIVRWRQSGSWRRVVLLTAKVNPAGRS
jgi:type IV pilus assembly protein PilV